MFILMTAIIILSCNREDESKIDNSSNPQNNKSLKIGVPGDGNGQFAGVFFAPTGTLCSGGSGQPALAIPELPYGIGDNIPRYRILVTANLNSTLQGGNAINIGKADLTDLIVSYLESQGIAIEQDAIYGNTTPAGSYFSTMNYTEYTFSDTLWSGSDYLYMPNSSFMNRDVASAIIQNAYVKITTNINYPIQNNQIKAIRIYYDSSLCTDPEKDLKIQVIY